MSWWSMIICLANHAMSELEYSFDPAWIECHARRFSERAVMQTVSGSQGQQLFYLLQQPKTGGDSIFKAFDFVRSALKAAESEYASLLIEDYDAAKPDVFSAANIEALPERLSTGDNLQICLEQSAAVLLTQPCWLEGICQAFSSQTDLAVRLMSIYLQLTRGEERQHSALLALYLANGITPPILHSIEYMQGSGVHPEMFDFAAVQLALARFPRLLFPELLGFTSAYFRIPTLIETCFPGQQATLFFQQRQQRIDGQLPMLRDCIRDYLELFPGRRQVLWQRLQQGVWLYRLLMQRCRDRLFEVLDNMPSARQAFVSLLQQKKPAALGHHRKIQLQGVSLEQWLAGMPVNSREFLQALQHSDYVDSSNVMQSRLLQLFDVDGPMYGVLDITEQETVRNWLQHGLNEEAPDTPREPEMSRADIFREDSLPVPEKCPDYNGRELYFHLVNGDLFPDAALQAKARVRRMLQACALCYPVPFRQYSHERFDAFIEDIYQREISAYKPLQGKPRISRQAYLWGLQQMAPTILIDGCWLQNCLSLQHVYPEIAEILFAIYCDETGNGQLQKNHPYIYRQLLDSLAIAVPQVHSEEFAGHPEFIDSAFDLPVFMLSLARFTQQFLPELLGLNMAIEISGLGKGYLQLVDEWSYWGIDPHIARIHIAIDNYASGHTHLAKKAIHLYLDEILQGTGDTAIRDRHWRRIHHGFKALPFVSGRFKLALPIWYMIRRLTHNNEPVRT